MDAIKGDSSKSTRIFVVFSITLVLVASLTFSYGISSFVTTIPSSGLIADTYSMNDMLQRFYSGRGYEALIPSGGNDFTYFGQGATMRYCKQEGFTYLASDGTLTNVDPSNTWPTITGGWYALFNTSQFYADLREILLGTELALYNPSAYPIIPNYEVWFYNYETIPESSMRYFLGNLSAYVSSLESLAGRKLWMIFNPCWEFNQDANDTAGSGWGAGGASVIPDNRGWNIPASIYNSQTLNWMKAKNETGATNILIGAHVCKLWSKTYNPYYLPGIRAVDVIGGSAYDDNTSDKFVKLKDFWTTVGGNKPLFFFEYNMDYTIGHNADANHIYQTYALIPSYPMLKGLSWWCPTVYDTATHNAIISMTAQYNGYTP